MNKPPRRRILKTLAFVVLIAAASASVAAGQVPEKPVEAAPARRFKAVAFDYLVLFNPESVVSEVERVFPGKGREFTNLWRTKQFEYSWLRSITGRYVDFFAITEDALVYTANMMKVDLPANSKRLLLNAYLHLEPWPDTVNALRKITAAGVRVIVLANFSPMMLRSNAQNAGLIGLIDALVSTDDNQSYKPDPRAYRLAMDTLRLDKQDILFVAFGSWDAAGAKSFGYTTFWVNRFNQPSEELGIPADQSSSNLGVLVDFILRASRAQ